MTLASEELPMRRRGQREEASMDTEMNTTEKPSAWETPEFVEIRMDAEIGSYQDDFDGQDYH
jgi:hypothetical protein